MTRVIVIANALAVSVAMPLVVARITGESIAANKMFVVIAIAVVITTAPILTLVRVRDGGVKKLLTQNCLTNAEYGEQNNELGGGARHLELDVNYFLRFGQMERLICETFSDPEKKF